MLATDVCLCRSLLLPEARRCATGCGAMLIRAAVARRSARAQLRAGSAADYSRLLLLALVPDAAPGADDWRGTSPCEPRNAPPR